MHRSAALLAFLPLAAIAQPSAVTVPFVGCKSDGQVGPVDAPAGNPKEVRLPAAIAERLAYYETASTRGIIAPRGWYCVGSYGSAVVTLFVSPRPIPPKGPDPSGPLIVISVSDAETSGRFMVAREIARVFPSHNDFVKQVLAEGIVPGLSFPSGPFPKDKLVYRNAETVEYETPPESDGLGTEAGLAKGADPIDGVAMLLPPDFSLLLLGVRLPKELRDLTPAIVNFAMGK